MNTLDTTVAGPVTRYLRCIRFRELFLLQGSPLLGIAFTIGEITPAKVAALVVFLVADLLLLAHTFTFNDWAEYAADLNDRNKASGVLRTREASRSEIGRLATLLLVASLVLFAALGLRMLVLAGAVAVLGFAYSHPAIHGKGIPILSSALHLVGGLLHFLLGYALFGDPTAPGVLIGVFFALTFAAGHLNQEIRDYEGDRLNGIRTNAAVFGPRPVFLAGLVLFTLAYAHLAFLAMIGVIPGVLGWLSLLYVLHLAWSIRVLRAGFGFESMSRFRDGYRILYAVIGLAMLVTLLARGA
jgi:4-hydroxybenzoate polyprenyltransferase